MIEEVVEDIVVIVVIVIEVVVLIEITSYLMQQKLNFKTTIKIDPSLRTPVDNMPLSITTKRILSEKDLTMTPVPSHSYEYSFRSDCVAQSRTGTGKTYAFGLPLIEKLVKQVIIKEMAVIFAIVLILEPTEN